MKRVIVWQLTTEDLLSFFVKVGHSDAGCQDGIVRVFGGEGGSGLSSQGVQLYCGDAAVKALNHLHCDLSLQSKTHVVLGQSFTFSFLENASLMEKLPLLWIFVCFVLVCEHKQSAKL